MSACLFESSLSRSLLLHLSIAYYSCRLEPCHSSNFLDTIKVCECGLQFMETGGMMTAHHQTVLCSYIILKQTLSRAFSFIQLPWKYSIRPSHPLLKCVIVVSESWGRADDSTVYCAVSAENHWLLLLHPSSVPVAPAPVTLTLPCAGAGECTPVHNGKQGWHTHFRYI